MTRTASSQSARIIAPRQSLVYDGTFPPRYAAAQNRASKEKGAPPSRSAFSVPSVRVLTGLELSCYLKTSCN